MYSNTSSVSTHLRHKNPTSETSSPASSSASDSCPCTIEGCDKEFSGSYARGSLARHLRQKHKKNVAVYYCENKRCGKPFCRSDSRLKHYRRYHPYLVAYPVVPRKSNRSQQVVTSIQYASYNQDAYNQDQVYVNEVDQIGSVARSAILASPRLLKQGLQYMRHLDEQTDAT